MKITELFTEDELTLNKRGGFIREQFHPEFPELRILNYTEAAQFAREWNYVTRACRGLIYNAETGEVLARPFPKIHNWDEADAPRITWDAPLYSWSNKEDGSLGIMYVRPDGEIAIATRGSFASEQAIHATALINAEGYGVGYHDLLEAGNTPLFEIVYPENRIVLDYGDRDELIYLGYIDNLTGAYYPDRAYVEKTFDDLRQDLSRENAEGWVAWLSPFKAVKIKQADYVELHRVVTGLNRKSIWRALSTGTYEDLLNAVPDELYEYVTGVATELMGSFVAILGRTKVYYHAAGGEAEPNQKQFALNVQEQVPRNMQGLVFSLRAGKDISPAIWKMIEPVGGER